MGALLGVSICLMSRFGDKAAHWRLVYRADVAKVDIPRLGKGEALRIKRAIESKLLLNPILYGLPLRGTLKRYWKLRAGDYRIVYAIVGMEVRILIIAHRRNVYRLAGKRDGRN
jgi:mRNA interferase RelE/StbE